MSNMRREIKVADRRRDVATMYLQGYKQVEIAQKHRVSQQMISQDLQIIQREWLSESAVTFDKVKAKELARIDALEREAWIAYRRSIGTREKTITAKTEGEGAYSRAEVQRETLLGDPRWLDKVQWCIEQRLKIFGVYASDKMQDEWQKEILAMLKDGKITIEDVKATLGIELYQQFFKSSGLVIVEAGTTSGEVASRDRAA